MQAVPGAVEFAGKDLLRVEIRAWRKKRSTLHSAVLLHLAQEQDSVSAVFRVIYPPLLLPYLIGFQGNR
jgi:hypothetical protein